MYVKATSRVDDILDATNTSLSRKTKFSSHFCNLGKTFNISMSRMSECQGHLKVNVV